MLTPSSPKVARKKTASKRPYMNQNLRRQRILETAAAIVERDGWAALNMSALAESGGTSRQLIYQHFPNLGTLLTETAWYIFNDTMVGTRQSISANPTSFAEAAKSAEAVTLDLPPGRGDALWQLLAGTVSATPELDEMRRGIRKLISSVWTPIIRKELALNETDGKVYVWMLLMSFWGMRQLVRDGEISRKRGVALFNELLERIVRK